MENCNCGCSEQSTKVICEYLPKCTKYIKIFVGLDYVGRQVYAKFIKHSTVKHCKTIDAVVDALGFITIDVKEKISQGFFFKGWFINYRYQVKVSTADSNIELTYEANKYCSLYFYVSECNDLETFTLNQ